VNSASSTWLTQTLLMLPVKQKGEKECGEDDNEEEEQRSEPVSHTMAPQWHYIWQENSYCHAVVNISQKQATTTHHFSK
jgi:hypothetical protein